MRKAASALVYGLDLSSAEQTSLLGEIEDLATRQKLFAGRKKNVSALGHARKAVEHRRAYTLQARFDHSDAVIREALLIKALNGLRRAAGQAGDWPLALRASQEAIALFDKHLSDGRAIDPFGRIYALIQYAEALHENADPAYHARAAEAVRSAENLIELTTHSLARAAHARALANQSWLLLNDALAHPSRIALAAVTPEEVTEARAAAERAIQVADEADLSAFVKAMARHALARVQLVEGRCEEARASVDEAEELYVRHYDNEVRSVRAH
jgi:tetratricopeptide (TPR) repeat protein